MKKNLPILIAVVLVIVLGIGAYFAFGSKDSNNIESTATQEPVATAELVATQEPVVVVPAYGELSDKAMRETWAASREIGGKLSFALTQVDMPGVTDSEEVQQAIVGVQKLLDMTALTFSGVKTPEATKFSLGLTMQDQSVVTFDVEINDDIIAVNSSLISGKRFTISMQQVKDMMASASEASDLAGVQAYIADALERYSAIAIRWFEGISVTEGTLMEASDTHNAVVRSEVYTITGDDAKALLSALFTEAANDEKLISYLEMLNADDEEADVKAQIEALVEELKEEDLSALTIEIAIGYDDKDEAVCVEVTTAVEDDTVVVNVDVKNEDEKTEMTTVYVNVIADGAPVYNYDVVITEKTLEDGNTSVTMTGNMMSSDSDADIHSNYTADMAMKVDDVSESMDMDMHMTSNVTEAATIGEATSMDMTMDVKGTYATRYEGTDFSSASSVAYDLSVNVEEETLKLGYAMNMTMESGEYVPEEVEFTDIDVMSMTQDDIATLAGEVQTGAMQAMFSAMSMIPEELLGLLGLAAQ